MHLDIERGKKPLIELVFDQVVHGLPPADVRGTHDRLLHKRLESADTDVCGQQILTTTCYTSVPELLLVTS